MGKQQPHRPGWLSRILQPAFSAQNGAALPRTTAAAGTGEWGVAVSPYIEGDFCDLPTAALDGPSREVRLLIAHREDLVGERTRIQNRLRWHLHELAPGGDHENHSLNGRCRRSRTSLLTRMAWSRPWPSSRSRAFAH